MSDMGKVLNSHTVQFERVFPGPIERVFDYLSKPELLEQWLMPASVAPHVGGRIEFKSSQVPETADAPPAGQTCWIRGIISAYEPPHLIAYSWNEIAFNMTSDVRFELKEQGENVLLVLTHTRIPTEFMPGVGAGWHTHLDQVLSLVKGETPEDFWKLFNPRVAQYKAAIAAAAIIIAAAAPAAQAFDKALDEVKSARNEVLRQYDQLWKDCDELKFQMNHVEQGRAFDDLDCKLRDKSDKIHRLEFELRDLDRALAN